MPPAPRQPIACDTETVGGTSPPRTLAARQAKRPPVGLLGLLAFSILSVASPVEAREVVAFTGIGEVGSVVVRTRERRLYLVRGDGTAWRYPVAVGRPGRQWFGESVVIGKHVRPAWAPPGGVRRDNPGLPDVVPAGADNNPLGERALSLPMQYAIHGTNRPNSIGTYASYGCIRMFNHDIVELFDQVEVGARVLVQR